MPNTQDIELYVGEDWFLDCTCRNANGSLMNLSSAEWRLANSTGLILKATVGNGVTLTGNGTLEIHIIPGTQTASNVNPGTVGTHEVFVYDTNSVGSVQIVGNVRLKKSLKISYP